MVSARHLASFTLYMSDYFNRLDHRKYIARILKSNCVMSTMCAQHWDAHVEMHQYSKEEIIFWRKNVSSVKSWHCLLTKTPQIAYSDASATGCGSVVSLDNEQICHRLCDQSETSNFGIESFGPIFEGTRVKLFTVNQAAAKIVEIERMRLNFHILAMSIFNACIKRQIKLEIQWIARTANKKVDHISLIDIDDWLITRALPLLLKAANSTPSYCFCCKSHQWI